MKIAEFNIAENEVYFCLSIQTNFRYPPTHPMKTKMKHLINSTGYLFRLHDFELYVKGMVSLNWVKFKHNLYRWIRLK